ncbi:ABC transporter permease [Gordonia sp. CPCC 206044]|uniref:ABC transporter permease n=1 Tax=Gordonia sp. CPCC 206044 TaxID=3140793 RepID=UPI003AF38011
MKTKLARHRWWVARTLVLPVHIIGFAIAAFFLVRLLPGDPVLARMDTTNGFSQGDYDRMAESMGLDGSIWSQLTTFVGRLLHFDLGISATTNQPVWQEIMTRLPATLELIFLGLAGAVIVTLALALLSVSTTNKRVQRPLRFYANLTGALPDFAVAILGIVVFYVVLQVVPAPIGRVNAGEHMPLVTGFPLLDTVLTGRLDVFFSMSAHYALPILVIVFIHASGLWRQLRLGLVEQIEDPATLFKIASGATRRSVYSSVLRRASASSIVMLGAKFGALLGGVIVLEQLFGFGGVGQFSIDAVNSLDFLGLQGFLIVIAALCLITFFVVDLVNMMLDPRRRPGLKADA